MSQLKNISIAILILALGAIAFYLFSISGSPLDQLPDEAATTTKDVSAAIAQIEEFDPNLSTSSAIARPIPDLSRPITFTGNFTEAQKIDITAKINDAADILKKNPDNFSVWLEYAAYRKAAGDFEGARLSWEYAGRIRPQNTLSFLNLGFLYGYHLKDTVKAEENYLRAIKNNKQDIFAYFQTFQFYKDIGNMAKAKAIVAAGVKANPGDADLGALWESIK